MPCLRNRQAEAQPQTTTFMSGINSSQNFRVRIPTSSTKTFWVAHDSSRSDRQPVFRPTISHLALSMVQLAPTPATSILARVKIRARDSTTTRLDSMTSRSEDLSRVHQNDRLKRMLKV